VTALDRICGALLGVAVGDAMGMPGEGWPHGRIAAELGRIDGFQPAPDTNEITRGLKAYEVTDDTTLTFIVASAIVESGGAVDGAIIVDRIEAWARTGAGHRNYIGPSTKRAFSEIARGVPLGEAGRYGDTNGGAMRITPIGAIQPCSDRAALLDAVWRACMPTHNTDVAISGAAAIAAAVSYAIDAERPHVEEAAEVAVVAAREAASLGFATIAPSVARKIELATSLAAAGRPAALGDIRELIGTGLPAHAAVPAAFAIARLANGDPMESARLAANLGGDTDTIGSMACAICGALAGASAFPTGLAEQLERVNTIAFAPMARALAELRATRRGSTSRA
jgi:ADP-ribosylglycohydrolase